MALNTTLPLCGSRPVLHHHHKPVEFHPTSSPWRTERGSLTRRDLRILPFAYQKLELLHRPAAPPRPVSHARNKRGDASQTKDSYGSHWPSIPQNFSAHSRCCSITCCTNLGSWVTVQIPMVVESGWGGGWAPAGAGDGSEPRSVSSRAAAAAEACRSAPR